MVYRLLDSSLFILHFHSIHFLKRILSYATDGAYPIIGDVFEGGAGFDVTVRVAHFGVVNPIAYGADVLFHIAGFKIKSSRSISISHLLSIANCGNLFSLI